MANLRLLIAISLALLLISRPALRFAAAQEEDDADLEEDFGEEDAGEVAGEEDNFEEGFEGGEGDEDAGLEDHGFDADQGNFEPDPEIPEGDDGDVKALTNETLAEYVEKGDPFLLEFYAPWCGHCKALAPEFKAAAAVLKEHNIVLAKIDATTYSDTSSEYGVEGYPSLLWIAGKSIKQYNGGRSSAEIVSWVKKRIGFAVQTLSTEEEAKHVLEENSAVAAGYFPDLKSKEALAFADAGKESDDVQFVQTDKPEVAKALGLSVGGGAAVAVLKREEDKFVAFDGEYSGDAITQFVMANKLPLFVTFSDEVAQLLFGGSIKKHVFLFFPDEEHAALTLAIAPVARGFRGQVIFTYINSTEDGMDNVREFFGVTKESRTALGFSTENREDGEKFQMSGELNAENLQAFTSAFVEGTATRFFKSEAIPEKNDGPVTVVVGHSFNDIVLDPTKDVLLEVYAPWCGHCKALEPTYKKLGKKFSGVGSVVIAKMDGTTNEHPDVKIEGFPTLLFYPANDKSSPIKVDVDRKLGALVKFVTDHASIPFELPKKGPEPPDTLEEAEAAAAEAEAAAEVEGDATHEEL